LGFEPLSGNSVDGKGKGDPGSNVFSIRLEIDIVLLWQCSERIIEARGDHVGFLIFQYPMLTREDCDGAVDRGDGSCQKAVDCGLLCFRILRGTATAAM